jgi:hypothetical protein
LALCFAIFPWLTSSLFISGAIIFSISCLFFWFYNGALITKLGAYGRISIWFFCSFYDDLISATWFGSS